jgi:hypothetical protein
MEIYWSGNQCEPYQVKVKFTLEQATKAQGGVEVQLYSFFNLGAWWGLVVNAIPRPLYPGKTRYPLYRWLIIRVQDVKLKYWTKFRVRVLHLILISAHKTALNGTKAQLR